MTIPTNIGGTPRVRTPEVYERGIAHTTRMEWRLGGDLVTPSGTVTFTLYGPTGAVVHTGTATVAGSVSSITVPSDSLPSTLSFGAGYLEEWSCTIASASQVARRDAWLARRALLCPVTQADLETLHPSIAQRIRSGSTSIQPQIDTTWTDTLSRLMSAGQWPARIIEPSSLTPYVRNKALAACFRTMIQANAGPDSNDERQAIYYDAQAEQAWSNLSYLADDDQDGVPDSETVRQGPGGVYARSVPPVWSPYRRSVI